MNMRNTPFLFQGHDPFGGFSYFAAGDEGLFFYFCFFVVLLCYIKGFYI